MVKTKDDKWHTTGAEIRKREERCRRAFNRWRTMNYPSNYRRLRLALEHMQSHSGPMICFAISKSLTLQRIKDSEYHRLHTREWMRKKYHLQGKDTILNQEKGKLLEKATSKALENLRIPHKHNPFGETYFRYTGKTGDILINELNLVIECKNLSFQSAKYLNREWVRREVTDRKETEKFKYRILVVSYPLPQKIREYLNFKGWKVISIGYQVTSESFLLTIKLLMRKLFWLSRMYKRLND